MNGSGTIERFIPLLRDMSPKGRGRWIEQARNVESEATTDALVELAGGKSPTVAIAALAGLPQASITDEHLLTLEGHLTTQSSARRAALFGALRQLPDARLIPSIERLSAGTTAQRDAAAELSGLRRRARDHDRSEGEGHDPSAGHVSPLTDDTPRRLSLAEDAAGAVSGPIPAGGVALDPATPPAVPAGWRPPFDERVNRLLQHLDELANDHRLGIVEDRSGEELLIGNIDYIPAGTAGDGTERRSRRGGRCCR